MKINSTETGKFLQVLPHIHECDKKLYYRPQSENLRENLTFQEMYPLAT